MDRIIRACIPKNKKKEGNANNVEKTLRPRPGTKAGLSSFELSRKISKYYWDTQSDKGNDDLPPYNSKSQDDLPKYSRLSNHLQETYYPQPQSQTDKSPLPPDITQANSSNDSESSSLSQEDRMKLIKSLRNIAKKTRRPRAFDQSHLTVPQVVYEILMNANLIHKLEAKGLANKQTLQFMRNKIDEINFPEPSDFNTITENFNKLLEKLERDKKLSREDVEALRIEPGGLKGGLYGTYNADSQQFMARFTTLKDPEGKEHLFYKGEEDILIADSLNEYYTNRYVTEQVRYWRQWNIQLNAQQIEYYKQQYNNTREKAFTEQEIPRLLQGENLHGWTCTELRYTPIVKWFYRTDKGTPMIALDTSVYQAYSKQEHNSKYPYPEFLTNPYSKPRSSPNCFGARFARGWLLQARPEDQEETLIRTILDDHEYYRVTVEEAQQGDLVAYHLPDKSVWPQRNPDRTIQYKPDGSVQPHQHIAIGSISHLAIVVNKYGRGNVEVEDKQGAFDDTRHHWNAPRVRAEHGEPAFYRTNRPEGHGLLTEQQWQARQPIQSQQ